MRLLLGLFALALMPLAGCAEQSGLPAKGESLVPSLSRPLSLEAGKKSAVYVRLQAIATGGAARDLAGFDAAQGKDPEATLVFFDSEGTEIERCTTALDTKC